MAAAAFCLVASWPRSLASYSLQGGKLGRLAGSHASGLVRKKSLSRAEAAVPRADGSMASSVSRRSSAVGGKSLNVSAILRRYGRCGLKSVTSGSLALAQ